MLNQNIIHHNIRTARWDISPYCNLNCIHCCAEGLYDSLSFKPMNNRNAISLIDKLLTHGIKHLNILGKEPFLYPDFVSIVKYACDLGFQVDITTNGTAIKDEYLPILTNLGIRSIFFSLDGSNPEINDTIRGAGTFKKAITTLKKFLSQKKWFNASIMINVNTVLTKINCNDILNIIEMCAELKIDMFKLSKLLELGNVSRNIDQLLLNPEEEFAVAENVIKNIPKYPELCFDILTDKPLVLEYFYKKYKAIFPVRMSGCKACIKEIYIDPTGIVFPCLGTSRGFPSTSAAHLGCESVNIFDIPETVPIGSHLYYDFSKKFPLVRETYQHYRPCYFCPYLTTICYPCPLYSVNESYTDNYCLLAKQRLDKL